MFLSPAPIDNLLLFTPHVPRRVTRNGWTPEVQRAFIAALARCGVVASAARSVGRSPRSAHRLRVASERAVGARPDVALPAEERAAIGNLVVFSFANAWDRALDHGLHLQREVAIDVALTPQPIPIVRRGRVIGSYDRLNESLALTALSSFHLEQSGFRLAHQRRIEDRDHYQAAVVEAAAQLGPLNWPDPAPPPKPPRRSRAGSVAEPARTLDPSPVAKRRPKVREL
ncbi:hypothetical protein BH09PSE4_BH09PSE4_22270 [soil metagenome]